jgi:AraC-like DNA-binding protein
MLKYLNSGVRTEAQWPSKWTHTTRDHWEFMAILEGEACQMPRASGKRRFYGRRLYVTAPGSNHTWRVPEGKSCEVVVMHFDKIPAGARRMIGDNAPMSVPLSAGEATRVREICKEVLPHYHRPRMDSVFWYDRALLNLCIIILRNGGGAESLSGFNRAAERAQLAIQYYRDHLGRHLTVRQICKAIHISPPQLRRIFKQALNESPKQVCTRIALDEACRLAVETALSLKEISGMCGYGGFSQFFRAFRAHYKMAPEVWRNMHRPAGKMPVEPFESNKSQDRAA